MHDHMLLMKHTLNITSNCKTKGLYEKARRKKKAFEAF